MSDIPDKPPIKHEHMVRRCHTVSDLLDDTIRGINSADRPLSVIGLTKAEGTWQQVLAAARESLRRQVQLNADTPEQNMSGGSSLVKLLEQQLDALKRMSPENSRTLITDLINNEKQFSTIESLSGKVREALRAGYMPAVIEQQHKLIGTVDSIKQEALIFQIDCTERALKEAKDPAGKSALKKALEDMRVALAASFIERARLSAFLSNDRKVYQSEKMLSEALAHTLPGQALLSPFVSELKTNAGTLFLRMRIENNLLELFDNNFSKFELQQKENVITLDVLKMAKLRSADETFSALVDFLSDKYSYLTRKHWPTIGKDGIKRSDIVEYEKERAGEINDLKI